MDDRTLADAFGDGRLTAQRAIVARAAAHAHRAFTIDELAADVRARDPRIGTATVYRAVSAMEATGWLERVGERRGSALYARCDAGDHHHHHVVCTGCGRVEAATCPLARTPDEVTDETGFVVTGHEVTLYGLCPSCLAAGA